MTRSMRFPIHSRPLPDLDNDAWAKRIWVGVFVARSHLPARDA
jgi:hypothetical protein